MKHKATEPVLEVIRAAETMKMRDGSPVELIDLKPGTDYQVVQVGSRLRAEPFKERVAGVVGGFHFDLGGSILRTSIWDAKRRPAADPRGMFFVEGSVPFWCDIYLMNRDGLSRADSEIADGYQYLPHGYKDLTQKTAVKILAQQGKQLLSCEEFRLMASGVREGLATETKQLKTGRFPGLTSSYGAEQATGTLWVWSREIDTAKWPYILGGSWLYSGYAGPSCVDIDLPGNSYGILGARGRCDHLNLS